MKELVCYLESFIKLIATIKYSEFNRILTEEFKHKKPSDSLILAIYESMNSI